MQQRDRSVLRRKKIHGKLTKAPVELGDGGGMSLPPVFNQMAWGTFAFNSWLVVAGGASVVPASGKLTRNKIYGKLR